MRAVMAVLAATAVALSVACTPLIDTPVILISIDCLNQRQLEQAVEHGVVPRLSALRGDSLVFERGYSHAPWTNPSHMSMLTGLYPSQHGGDLPFEWLMAWRHSYDRVPRHATLPETLRKKGYATMGFVGRGSISGAFGMNRGFDTYSGSSKKEDNRDLPKTIADIDAWLEERTPAQPFFLFVHTFDFHDPMYADETTVLIHMDLRFGALLASLRERGLYDPALILLTGDHGSRMLHTETKCCVHGAGHYEENLHVPLWIKFPKGGPRGIRKQIARHVDLYRTVLDVLGIDDSDYIGPGVSLVSVAEGDAETHYSFSEADAASVRRFGLVSERYKYIYTPHDYLQELLRRDPRFLSEDSPATCQTLPAREELYDLERDPFEDVNLLLGTPRPEELEVLTAMRAEMERHLNLPIAYERRILIEEPKPIESELLESLRALGYVE
jgi:arylsulfatase A-like enzyme